MKNKTFLKQVAVCALVLSLAMPFAVMAQVFDSDTTQTATQEFRQEELDQILAPIALYPDALLAQILSASTYPIEVVAAARFLNANPGLSAAQLLEAAQDKDWDPSVKALLEFPRILTLMDQEIEWTSKLGDSFLAQKADVMDSIQRLRQKAYAAGNLATTQEQLVNVEPQNQIIIIESATPYVVYVPVYDPRIVYGNWWYPAYPPYYFYLPRYVGAAFFSGIYVDFSWGWGAWGFSWYSRDVFININYYNTFTSNHYRRPEHYRHYSEERRSQPWQHDPQHRRGIVYRDSSTAQRFGGVQRAEPARIQRAPEPRVRTQVNTAPLPATSTINLSTVERRVVTDSRRINLQNAPSVKNDPKPLKAEIRHEPKAETRDKPLNPKPNSDRQQSSGAIIRQNAPNIQRNDAGNDKAPRQEIKTQAKIQEVPKVSAPNINRQNIPVTQQINRNADKAPRQEIKTQAKVQQAPKFSSPALNLKTAVKQSISNLRDNSRAQVNVKAAAIGSRQNTGNNRVSQSSRQPKLKAAPSFNIGPNQVGGFVRGGPGR